MDKLMNNHWFMKIISLLLALMLFMSVYLETQPKQKEAGLLSTAQDSEVIEDFPVTSYFDNKKYVVTGVPQVVNVTLHGPTSKIKPTIFQNDFEVYVDLRELGVGTHEVRLRYKDISNKLEVDIQPKEITVTIQERLTKEFPVDVDLIREEMIKDGYTAESAIVKPNVVKVTGAKTEIEKISFVEARVDLQNVSDTIEQESRVAAYDANGNMLNVEIIPEVVTVKVPITSPSKTVPFKLNRKGTIKEGISIVDIQTDFKEITIFGPKSIIEEIDQIEGMINLAEISEDAKLELTVTAPQGIKKIEPNKVEVTIDIDKEVKKTFSNLPIALLGKIDDYEYLVTDPSNSTISLDIFGAQNVINNVKPTDLKVFVDVGNLNIGEHKVSLEISVPQNVSWKLERDTATVEVSNKVE